MTLLAQKKEKSTSEYNILLKIILSRIALSMSRTPPMESEQGKTVRKVRILNCLLFHKMFLFRANRVHCKLFPSCQEAENRLNVWAIYVLTSFPFDFHTTCWLFPVSFEFCCLLSLRCCLSPFHLKNRTRHMAIPLTLSPTQVTLERWPFHVFQLPDKFVTFSWRNVQNVKRKLVGEGGAAGRSISSELDQSW